MKIVDFSRSFLTFRIDTEKKPTRTGSHRPPYTLNNARIQLECVCTISDQSGYREEFALGASCKTERVGVEQDIWTEPNADFVPIFGRERFMNLKAFSQVGQTVKLYPPSLGDQPERQVGLISEALDDGRIDIERCEGEVLSSTEQIVASVLANEALIARTQLITPRYHVTLEYPVKTINVNERDWVFQTDTGPVLLPDCDLEPDDLISGMELAYSAFNGPDWIEFLLRVPTPITGDISVHHYSQPVRWDANNQLVRMVR